MTIKEQIDQDLKTAMLSGDRTLTTTLRGLKSAILNVEIAKSARETGLPEEEVTSILQKEAKKRQESADFFGQGGNTEKQQAELAEKEVIAKYLPEALSEEDLSALVEAAVTEVGSDKQKMGQIIGVVKQKAGAGADGAVIARLVREKLQ